ncbi:unnamed protein product [Lepidochelys olivacea]
MASDSLVVCDVDPALKEKLRKFRFRKETNNAAILMKIDKERQLVVLEEEFQDISPEELKSELPERQPRYPSAVGRGGGIRASWQGTGLAHGGRMPGVCMRDVCGGGVPWDHPRPRERRGAWAVGRGKCPLSPAWIRFEIRGGCREQPGDQSSRGQRREGEKNEPLLCGGVPHSPPACGSAVWWEAGQVPQSFRLWANPPRALQGWGPGRSQCV